MSVRRVLWCSHCLRTDARLARRKIRTEALNKPAGIKAYDPGVRMDSLAPRSTARPAEARAIVYGDEAATEMAKYTQRLNALDWRIDEMLFNLEFEVPYTSFWAWRGVVEDR